MYIRLIFIKIPIHPSQVLPYWIFHFSKTFKNATRLHAESNDGHRMINHLKVKSDCFALSLNNQREIFIV